MASSSHFLFISIHWLIIVSFLIYGASCFVSENNRLEFERYNLPHLRKITGSLQLMASFGLIIGFYVPWLVAMASFGLTLMMFCALIVRFRLKDNLFSSAPALFYLIISFALCLNSVWTLTH